MSFFDKKQIKIDVENNVNQDLDNDSDNYFIENGNSVEYPPRKIKNTEKVYPSLRPQWVIQCQLAHGSPTGFISGFSNVKELYQKIAECYDFPVTDLLFCTINTHKIDMEKLLGAEIGPNDFLFAHKKGQPKEIEIIKDEEQLGITIADNGADCAFIKRIEEGSVIHKIPQIFLGDHIEKLDGVDLSRERHYDVAKRLRAIPVGTIFTIRLVEPLKIEGFNKIAARCTGGEKSMKKCLNCSGIKTLRFKANGRTKLVEEQPKDKKQIAVDAINEILDTFLGISDDELAEQIWDLGKNEKNSMNLADAIDNSDLKIFQFPDDFIIEIWGAITDVRQKRKQ